MTRINSGVNPEELHQRHLIAEYREITMVPAALKRALRTKTIDSVLKSIPRKFSLNKGHVSFFYDKQLYLVHRFNRLIDEMKKRGYNYDQYRDVAFMENIPTIFYGDWKETEEARNEVIERIRLRVSEKPHLYKGYTI